MPDPFIGLLIGKKWRMMRDVGFPVVGPSGEVIGHEKVEFKDPWVPMLAAAKDLLTDEYFRVSEWSEQHFHDFVMYDKLITWGCASSGKALLPDEPVYYKDRIGRIGDVKPGDLIFSSTGDLVRVRGVYRQIDMPLYRVRFSDGTETICAKDHLWTVRYWGRVRWDGKRPNRKGVYGWITATVPVDRIASWSNVRARRLSIPVTRPIRFDNGYDLAIDPYVLGVLIGDASITGTVLLSSHRDDVELRDEVNRRLSRKFPGYGLVRVGSSATAYMVVSVDGSRERNPVVKALKDLGLYGHVANEKFIPEVYKFASVDDRLDLIAGLFDTDGTVCKSGHMSFTTVSRRLAEDVKFVLGSLGVLSTIHAKKTKCQPAYTVYVRAADASISRRMFKLARKADRLREHTRCVGRRYVESVRLVEDRENYPRETVCLTIDGKDLSGNDTDGLFPVGDFVVTHNSNDTALLLILDWMVDPYDTVTLLGSTTKQDLKSRSWEAVVRYHNALKICNRDRFTIPGKISKQGQALVNIEDDDAAGSAGEKAGIQGRALNEDGRLQGAHAKNVRLVVDELAEITNHEAIKVAMANLRVGTESFKFIGLANPESWENPSCQYCMPPNGVASVNVDTGSWMSTFGCFVRHHDGLKSPCVREPELRKRFPFLISKEEVESTLAEAGGNPDAPQFWKMVRGFPVPSGAGAPVVLDARIAEQQHASDPVTEGLDGVIATVAGIDPAWSEGGDNAYRARAYIRRDAFGRPYLDFTNGLRRLNIFATDPRPPVQQMRDQVIDIMREPAEAPFEYTAVDASANQGLADDLMIYAGANCLAVNNSVRASENQLRFNDPRPTKDTIYDRGTESWCVLAEFIKAGMVRGLPMEALAALTSRRFAMKRGKNGVLIGVNFPLRLEDKAEFRKRFKASPDACDACANAALAAKERYGLLPFGYLPEAPQSGSMFQNAPIGPVMTPLPEPNFGTQFDDSEMTWCP